MNFLMRRYREDGKISYFFVLGFCFLMSIIFSALSYVFLITGTYWSILPISGTIFSILSFYSLTSYSKPKYKMEGHYQIKDFYNVVNPIKKVNFFLEYISGLICMNASIHFFFMGYLLEKFNNPYLNNGLIAFFFISSVIAGAWVRLSYIKNLNNNLIIDIKAINFLKNFFYIDYAKQAYEDYISFIKKTDNLSILKGEANEKLSKNNFLSILNHLETQNKKLLKQKKLIENPSHSIKKILNSKELIENDK